MATDAERRARNRQSQQKSRARQKQKKQAAQNAAPPPPNAPILSQSSNVVASSSTAPAEQQGLASGNVDQSSDPIQSARVDHLPSSSIDPIFLARVDKPPPSSIDPIHSTRVNSLPLSSIDPIHSTRVNMDSHLVRDLFQQFEPDTSSKPPSAGDKSRWTPILAKPCPGVQRLLPPTFAQSVTAQMPDEPPDAASDPQGMGADLVAQDVLRLMGGLPFRQ